MRTFSVSVTSKEYQCVMQVREVDLNGYIMHPRLDAVREPLWVYRRFENQSVRGDQSLEATRPAISVNL